MKDFTKEFCERLELKGREIEGSSSVEIVPVVMARAASYRDFRIQYALIAALCSALTDAALGRSWIEAAIVSAIFFAGVFGLISIPAVLRFILPSKLKQEAVIDQADAAFLHEEVFATRARTGVLVFLSIFEREVFVIGDKGLAAKMPSEYWKQLGQRLASDFAHKNPGESFFTALDELVRDVAPHFPVVGDNPNELPDRLRKR